MSLNGGYAMIKYNSTQEELQIAYRSKKPVLFYDENQKAHWAVIEETAKQSVDEETQEPITLYEYSYKLLDEASTVVANPTLSGDEANLEGAEIDGIKYKIGGGGKHLYFHNLSIGNTTSPNSTRGCLEIYNDNNTPFSDSTLAKYIYDLGFVNGGNSYYPIPLVAHNSNVGTFKNSFYIGIQGVLKSDTYNNRVFSINEYGQLENSISALNIVDIITQIF